MDKRTVTVSVKIPRGEFSVTIKPLEEGGFELTTSRTGERFFAEQNIQTMKSAVLLALAVLPQE